MIGALEDIKQNYGTEPADLVVNEYISPEVVMTPAEAFYKPSELLSLEKCRGRIATESVMLSAGIPILAPGERVTPEILEYIQYARDKGSLLTGTEDPEVRQLYVMLGNVAARVSGVLLCFSNGTLSSCDAALRSNDIRL